MDIIKVNVENGEYSVGLSGPGEIGFAFHGVNLSGSGVIASMFYVNIGKGD